MVETGALAGLRVVDFADTRVGAQASQLLADFGAEVVHVEPRSGASLRSEQAWPFWARGKKSIALDLRDPSDAAVALRLAAGSDVLIETWRPGVAERLGLGYERLSQINPHLVHASVTGFGRHGPLADIPGYEAIVCAKFGAYWTLEGLADRPGPAFGAAPYAAYAASQLLLQGILAALYERERSGAGQKVETSLAQALSTNDIYEFYNRVVASRFAGGIAAAPRTIEGVPTGGLLFRVLTALTADGRWLQFGQLADRLFRAMMELFELDWMFDDPEWSTAPDFEDLDRRRQFWEHLLEAVRSKTLAEWSALFERHPDVWAELFRKEAELLDHPQIVWDGMVAEIHDAERGPVRQPGPLVRMSRTPARLVRSAPALGEHGEELRAETLRGETLRAGPSPAAGPPPSGEAPLAGVTVLELGVYFAAPFGATLLAELGARVIKLEQPDGDPIRSMLPFPELGAMKVLQGKDCVAVDLNSEKGREVAHRLVAQADIVLQSFRAGVARRLGLDAETLLKINPDLVYLCAPGYGEGGPCGSKPAFAPTIGAAAAMAWRTVGSAVPERDDLSLDEVKRAAMQLSMSILSVGNADGFAGVSAAVAMLLGLLARRRGAGGQELMTTMLSSAAHALSEITVEYEGRPVCPAADPGLFGLGALYRLYRCADEWVFLAAPGERDWMRLTAAPEAAALFSDPRFQTAQGRAANDEALAERLAGLFAGRAAIDWERDLTAAGVACVVAERGPVAANYVDEGRAGHLCGLLTTGTHPILDEVPRLKPLLTFSRSAGRTGDAGLVGQHTGRVLREFGFTDAEIAALAAERVVLQG